MSNVADTAGALLLLVMPALEAEQTSEPPAEEPETYE